MIIQFVGIGNKDEAFIETSFSEKMNIISSDDNNRGKTIIIQSLLYCLGNKPAFPSTFNVNEYYYIVGFSIKNQNFKLCRKANSFILITNNNMMVFNNISELKRHWNKSVMRLPLITKDSATKIVDPELFYQLNFVGQDKKDTSNIANKGYYNKNDFHNMLLSIEGLNENIISVENLDKIKKELSKLKSQRHTLLKQHKILKQDNPAVVLLSNVNYKEKVKKQLLKLDILNKQLSELTKQKNNVLNRKSKCIITIKELKSLNRTIQQGELRCLDCNSKHIGFFNSDNNSYSFDISTPEVRHQIIESIEEKVESYEEEFKSILYEIGKRQEEINEVLTLDEVSLETLLAFKEDYWGKQSVEKEITEMDDKISELENLINSNRTRSLEDAKKQKHFLDEITKVMKDTYDEIDFNGNLEFESIFTKSTQIYSGSEATIYHLVKVYSIAKLTKHQLPIIVDSFRAEDLSTEKEINVLKIFNSLNSQIIFTTTLKKEEVGKYENNPFINSIDYSTNVPSKILNPKYVPEFEKLLAEFSISF